MNRATFLTPEHREKLKIARAHLCDITDDPQIRIHPLSEEYAKVNEIVGLIEKLMGII